uniref:Uncharacterized protein n=1 Tax=Avena sativa TaxID=4498 RepID=A0ACD5ZGU2_AVESA
MSTAMVLLVLAVLVLPSASASENTAAGLGNCSDPCGYAIPYPFGVGPRCSSPGFSLTCAVDTDNSTHVLLGNTRTEVDIPPSTSYPSLRASISYSVRMIPGVRDYSVHWEAPARPFAISASSGMSLFVVGCDVRATLFIGSSAVEAGTTCSVVCAEAQVMEKLPMDTCDGSMVGAGCCSIDVRVNLRAFTLNITRISSDDAAARSKKVLAFISGHQGRIFRPIDALRSALPTLYHPLGAQLDWAIPYQPNCERAMEDKASYACRSKHSTCWDSPIGGYVCHCPAWSEGNAYIDGGCREDHNPPVLYDSIQPRRDCPTSCGNVSIPFPFGTELGCFAKLPFYLACIPGTTSVHPVPQLTDRMAVTDISIDDGTLHVHEASETTDDFMSGSDSYSDSTLYALSGRWGVVKWVIDNVTCEHAKLNNSDYKCFSSHSDCLDATHDGTLTHLGYRCKCSSGFEGNPYIKDGCTDINEWLQPDKYICNGICHNSFGSYMCTRCRRGTDFNSATRNCKPSAIILGVTIEVSSGGGILFLAAIVAILARTWKRGVQKRLRRRHFRGILLEQLVSSDQSASDRTRIFSLEELQKATNNFDHSRVVGRGGHGTVYKSILTDQRVVAIKKSTLAVMSEIDQFINEVSILSQIR